MPGKLAAARASREASERLAQLPRRAASTKVGLPTELEDASACGETSTTFARLSGGRLLRHSSTENCPPPSSKPQDAHASSQSVTFFVSSGQHGLHGTPTATAAALAQAALGTANANGPASANLALPSRSAGTAAMMQAVPFSVQPSGPSGLRSAPTGAAVLTAESKAHQGTWLATSGSSLNPRSSIPWVTSAEAEGPGSVGAVAGPSTPSASATAITAAGFIAIAAASAGPGSNGGSSVADHVWTTAALSERARSVTAAPHRHSRLRVAAVRLGPSGEESASRVDSSSRNVLSRRSQMQLQEVDANAPPAAPYGLTTAELSPGASDGTPPTDILASAGNGESLATWTASAARPFSGAGSSSAGGTPGVVATGNSFIGRGRAPRRPMPAAAAGFGTVSELFAEAGGMEESPSAESSFTVRQTPSDLEDEVLERARTRRAIRSVTLATMAMDRSQSDAAGGLARAASGRHLGEGASPARQSARAAEAGTAVDVTHPSENGARVIIRLNHQPGHHRRPPNRHASMPAMKRDAANPGAGHESSKLGNGGAAGGRRSPLMRPPLSAGLLPEEPEDGGGEDGAPEDPSNVSLPYVGGGGADVASGYSRMPSDSPVTSQMSITSSVMGPGPSSTAQQRYQSMPSVPQPSASAAAAAAAAAASAAASLALSPAQPPIPLSRLAGSYPQGAAPTPPAMRVRVPDLLCGSSGQRGSFEEDVTRVTPAFVGSGPAPAALMQSSPSHLLTAPTSGVGLAVDRLSHMSGRVVSGAHAQHSNNLVALHKAVEKLMLQDSGLYTKVQASMKGISSLAKETNKLEFVRDASGATVINQYVVVKTLGRGAFGKVKLCLNTLDGQLYAVKMINRAHLLRQLQKPSRPLRRRAPPPRNTSDTGLLNMHLQRTQTDGNLSISHTNISTFGNAAQAAAPARASMDDTSPLAAIMREIAVMKKVDHPHVVRLHEVIDPPGSSYLMMVMEYCEGGCVMETRAQTGLTPLAEDTAREYFRQACLGLDYLHYNNVVHGDLKPENMLVSGTGLLKIADFGSSRFMGGDPTDATKTSCTPAFQSPEEISHLPVDPFAADLWALACCLFCFVFGRLPFVGSCVVDIYRAILTRPHTYPEDATCSPGLRDLLDRMLHKDPKRRLMLKDVGQHDWVTAGGLLPPLQFLHSLAATGGEAPPPIIHVTHAEQVNAIDRSSLVSLIRARLKEKTCPPGEYLFKEGEEAHCVYMIMAGVVELTQHLRRPGLSGGNHHGFGGHVTGLHGQPGGHGHVSETQDVTSGEIPGADHDASFSVDLDESLTLDHPDGGHITEAMNIVDGKLHIDRQQAIEMRRRMQGNLLGDNAEYVVEVKGPGSVIGEMGLDTAATATHRVSARARGPVTVVKLTEENFFKALLQMYGGGGGGGGSAASTTLTASSVSEAVGKGAVPGLSAQHLMVMQYLEDSGSFATFPAAAVSAGGAAGRYSIDAGAGPSTLSGRAGAGHNHHYHQQYQHQHHNNHQNHNQNHNQHGPGNLAGGGGSYQLRHGTAPGPGLEAGGSAAAAANAARSAFGVPSRIGGAPVVASLPARVLGAVGGGMGGRKSGANSMLGVLNTIHSINASRAGVTSDEGVADL